MRRCVARSPARNGADARLKLAELTSELAFCSSTIALAVTSIFRNHYTDNFDHDRFGVERRPSAIRQFKRFVRTTSWLLKNRSKLYETYTLLFDDQSKILYVFLLAYRIVLYRHIKIPVYFSKEKIFEFREIQISTESQYPLNGMFGGLRRYDFEFEGRRYISDGLGYEDYLSRRQYFYSSRELTVAPEPGDFVIDGGAFTGDSALVFSNAVGENGFVYSFDPVAEHIELLESNIQLFPFKNVKIMRFGLSDAEVFSEPIVVETYAPGFEANSTEAPLRSIDYLVANHLIAWIDFIKLDIEGGELKALKGAVNSLNTFKPKLAISIYHSLEDMFEIPLFLKRKFPFYRLVLGHYTIHSEETVLYCVPKVGPAKVAQDRSVVRASLDRL
jgi:FkbM family methyltransferase